MNVQTSFDSKLPFFDTSAKRVKLPQPASSRAHHSHQLNSASFNQRSPSIRRATSHLRTPSWDSLSLSDAGSPRRATTHLSRQYPQCFTPKTSRSSSPMEHLPVQPASVSLPDLTSRSPPMTPPTIQAILPPTAPIGNYRLRLEPSSPGENPQAVVVFPDAAKPTRALLLVGPAIARYVREGGKSARMHPYRVVFRPVS